MRDKLIRLHALHDFSYLSGKGSNVRGPVLSPKRKLQVAFSKVKESAVHNAAAVARPVRGSDLP